MIRRHQPEFLGGRWWPTRGWSLAQLSEPSGEEQENVMQVAHGKDTMLTNEQMDLAKGVLEHVGGWFFFPGFVPGFVIYDDVVVADQSESIRIVIEERKDYTFELRIQRSGMRDTAITAVTGATWSSTRWFVEQFTELPD
jgi:hypothetical protein